ncbi:MAG: Hpt domain-containing protein, partial [Prochlorothrix sp.]
MDAAQILGYFIEEAKEHLDTLEQSLATFDQTLTDGDLLQELFRAAHSIKGGAAMLDLEPVRYVAGQLEDGFKIIKEHPQIPAASAIGSLLQQSCADLRILVTLVEQQPNAADRDTTTEATTLARAKGTLATLQEHLTTLASQPPAAVAPPAPQPTPTPAMTSTPPASLAGKAVQEDGALQLIFRSDVPTQLRQMLQLFKQADNPASRQQLQDFCDNLERTGEQFDLHAWCYLVRMARAAIANPQNTYHTLAPIVIKELKQAQDAVLAGSAPTIQASGEFQAIVPPDWDAPTASPDDFDELLGSLDQVSLDGDLDLSFLGNLEMEPGLDGAGDGADPQGTMAFDQLFNELDADGAGAEEDVTSLLPQPSAADVAVPGMGSEELSNLADLFGGESTAPEAALGLDWAGLGDAELDLDALAAESLDDTIFSMTSDRGAEAAAESATAARDTTASDTSLSDLTDLVDLNQEFESREANAALEALNDLGDVGDLDDLMDLTNLTGEFEASGAEATLEALNALEGLGELGDLGELGFEAIEATEDTGVEDPEVSPTSAGAESDFLLLFGGDSGSAATAEAEAESAETTLDTGLLGDDLLGDEL